MAMTFGLCNALATFQTFMDTQFVDLIATGHIVIYLDDILIFATTLDKLAFYMHKVLKCLQELDLFLHPAKCSFNQTLVEYLGLIISEGELHMDLCSMDIESTCEFKKEGSKKNTMSKAVSQDPRTCNGIEWRDSNNGDKGPAKVTSSSSR